MSERITLPAGRTGPGCGVSPLHTMPAYQRWQLAQRLRDLVVDVVLRENSADGATEVHGLVLAVATSVMARQPEQLVVRTGPGRKTMVVPLGAIDHVSFETGDAT